MQMICFFASLLFVFLNIQDVDGQDNINIRNPRTISVENLIGDKRLFFQIMINKVFVEKKKIGLVSISSYAADNHKDLSNNEYLNVTFVYHHLFKGVGINSGAAFTSFEGWKPFFGLQYMRQSKSFSLIYLPGYYFLHTQKISNIALVEYKPAIYGRWSLYTRFQLHYSYDLEKDSHYRSYVYSRLGLSFNDFSFGLAQNFDRYGKEKVTRNNYGVFLKLSL